MSQIYNSSDLFAQYANIQNTANATCNYTISGLTYGIASGNTLSFPVEGLEMAKRAPNKKLLLLC